MTTQKTLLTTEDLAERWSITTNTLRTMARKGRAAPYFYLGGNFRWRIEDVLAFEAEQVKLKQAELAEVAR